MFVTSPSTTYKLEQKLQHTTTFTEYYAHDTSTETPVCIRLYQKDVQYIQHTEVDWNVIKHISHPLVPKFIDFFPTDDSFVLVSEYFSKISLTQLLNDCDQTLSEDKVWTIIKQLLTVLHFLHRLSVAHCGINPDNILVDSRTLEIRLTNFSNATGINFPPPKTSEYIISPPEIVTRAQNVKSYLADTFNVGVLMYSMITGKKPWSYFDRESLQEDYLNRIIEKPEKMSSACFGLVEKLIALNPSMRYSCEQALHHYWITKGRNKVIPTVLLKRAQLQVPILRNRVFSPTSPDSKAYSPEPQRLYLKLPERSNSMLPGGSPVWKTRLKLNNSFIKSAQIRMVGEALALP
ncbi:CAMK family protein kinase [Tritrichomonas foetus]|uniref:CAMK family protein kinase n=1 Tax=Tritrichomonas foetus TaxID=1144522 RepID=A0A1J4JKV0_9EUKA|nr:CAMK family protein kinase [Tritrichomonas foetus]|eukprot:OHS99706.1 CAMK family protein kinase [Tritrichomonas foetus]